jgi:hypothetical protein
MDQNASGRLQDFIAARAESSCTDATPSATLKEPLMNATAARRPSPQPELPPLPRRQRAGAAVASALISTVLLSSVVAGLTFTPDSASPLAGRATPATQA